MERIIGDFGEPTAEQLLLVVGGIHGNEPEGATALERVFTHLQKHKPPFNGRFIGLRGNLRGLKEGKRFIDKDLNRVWSEENVAGLEHGKTSVEHELSELKALLDLYKELKVDDYPKKLFFDLHGTSAADGIFLILQRETLPEESSLANFLTAPKLLGLHKELKNTTIPYMDQRGFHSIGFEGGQIGDPNSISNHEYILWETLLFEGFLQKEHIPQRIKDYEQLKGFASMLPAYLQVDYCHKIKTEDDFVMIPGFKNFDPVTIGDVIASDKNGEIRAMESGYILMPLYQKRGSDGFFLIRKADGVDDFSPKRDESYLR